MCNDNKFNLPIRLFKAKFLNVISIITRLLPRLRGAKTRGKLVPLLKNPLVFF